MRLNNNIYCTNCEAWRRCNRVARCILMLLQQLQ